jgi:hypothetical protein
MLELLECAVDACDSVEAEENPRFREKVGPH